MSSNKERASYGQDAATVSEDFCRSCRKSCSNDDKKSSRGNVSKGVSPKNHQDIFTFNFSFLNLAQLSSKHLTALEILVNVFQTFKFSRTL